MSATPVFSAEELRSLPSSTLVRYVDFHPQLDSTNDRALQLIAEGSVTAPTLVLAENQSAGRGRGNNRWWSAPGALTFSVIVKPSEFGLPATQLPLISLSTGLAISDAVRQLGITQQTGLKWPNDVHLAGRKVAGILVEIPPQPPHAASVPGFSASDPSERWMVVGVGVNVNNSFASAPEELRSTATALVDATGVRWEPAQVLTQSLQVLEQTLEQLTTRAEHVLDRWKNLCVLTGHPITVNSGGQRRSGKCLGIDGQGNLMLESPSGVETIIAGEAIRIG